MFRMSVAALTHFAQQRQFQLRLRMWRKGSLWYADIKVLDVSGAPVCNVAKSAPFSPGLLDAAAVDATNYLLQYREYLPGNRGGGNGIDDPLPCPYSPTHHVGNK